MSRAELEKEVQKLSPGELHSFTVWLAEYTARQPGEKAAIAAGVQRMEDIIKGQTTGLTESQFRQALR